MKLKTIFKLLLILMIISSCSQEPVLTVQGKTMGTWYTVKILGVKNEQDKDHISNAIESALEKVNKSLNTYDPESEISRFNVFDKDEMFELDDSFMQVTRTAMMIYERSNGAFDPTVKDLVGLWGFGDQGLKKRPDPAMIDHELLHVGLNKIKILDNGLVKHDPEVHLDYSAIAKGYGVDVVMDKISALGCEDILVEIGGEVKARGKDWRIGIAVPDDHNTGNKHTAEVITLKDLACATSGDYQQFYEEEGERYSHLIDPKTGYPIKHEVTSVTVIAESCMLADAAATAAIVLGKSKGLDFIESLEGVEAFFIYREDDQLKSMQSSGWIW
ncbi:MAG: FAD:protein FMN transferase [Candidatus Marinimicrobia bacterium]|nr:FAD:protein FMN transferase [Candidatus Neomarinimicrobiota bacterium]